MNKYMNTFENNKKAKNYKYLHSLEDDPGKVNLKFSNEKAIINRNLINNNANKNNHIFIRDNISSLYDLQKPYKNKYFDSITINNNNSVELKETKSYNQVEKNEIKNNDEKNNILQTYTNKNNINNSNKIKAIFKPEKNSISQIKITSNILPQLMMSNQKK